MPPSAEFATPPAALTLTFDSTAFDPEQALAIWRASMPYDASLMPGVAPAEFVSHLRAWRLDTLALTEGTQTQMRFVRTPERAATDARDNYCLMLAVDHGWSGELDVVVPRGEVCVIDFTRPFDVTTPGDRFIMLSIPRPTLAHDVAGDHHGTVFGGGPGQLLAAHFETLAHTVPQLSADDAARAPRSASGSIATSTRT